MTSLISMGSRNCRLFLYVHQLNWNIWVNVKCSCLPYFGIRIFNIFGLRIYGLHSIFCSAREASVTEDFRLLLNGVGDINSSGRRSPRRQKRAKDAFSWIVIFFSCSFLLLLFRAIVVDHFWNKRFTDIFIFVILAIRWRYHKISQWCSRLF